MKKYMAGNWLRSFFSGEFETIEEAWEWLSERFMISYPTESEGRRSIYMFVEEENAYGIKGWIQCKEPQEAHPHTGLDRETVLQRCKSEGSKQM